MENQSHLAFIRTEVNDLAHQLLKQDPDPAPRFLILRDLLHCLPGSPELEKARQDLLTSRHVQALAGEQHADGSWGRFHSQDSRLKSVFPTSEFAIRRALALGLDAGSPILQKAAAYIQAHLQQELVWSDEMEKHDDPRVFPHNIRSISAAMLALINPNHPLLEPFWQHWAQIVEAAFAHGDYDPSAELACHQALTGIPSRRLYHFHNYYPLIILSSTRNRLPLVVETRMLAFLFHKPGGIYYVCNRSLDQLPGLEEKEFLPWLHGQEILWRFRGWKTFAPPIRHWLWSLRNAAGLWRMGGRPSQFYDLPLSESWRKPGCHEADSSIKILALLERSFESDLTPIR